MSGGIGDHELTALSAARPAQRVPITLRQVNRLSLHVAGCEIKPPQLRAIVLPENSGTRNREPTAARDFSSHADLSRVALHSEQMLCRCPNHDIPRRIANCVHDRLACHTFAEIL